MTSYIINSSVWTGFLNGAFSQQFGDDTDRVCIASTRHHPTNEAVRFLFSKPPKIFTHPTK